MKIDKMKKAVFLVFMLVFFAVTLTSVSAMIYSNMPPNKPQKPDGPTGGGILFNRVVVGNSYTYTTTTTDPNGDEVYYKWDWGDGNQSDWDGPWASGMGVEVSHIWANSGVYEIRVIAKDVYDVNGSWSDPLSVTVSNKLSIIYMRSMVLVSSEMYSNSILIKNCL